MVKEAPRDILGMAICEALGIDPESVVEMDIVIRPRQAGLTICRRFTGSDVPKLKGIFEHYKLVPIEEEAEHGQDS